MRLSSGANSVRFGCRRGADGRVAEALYPDAKADGAKAPYAASVITRDGLNVVPIGGLSEGTIDQLYLSLRIAAVEDAIESGLKLPFLADDLFINFDDARSEAGFRVLAELAAKTQVLFFTHHDHLAGVAQRAMPDGVSRCDIA